VSVIVIFQEAEIIGVGEYKNRELELT